ncbi:type II toxin-antitoxin system Phd/YefM family antitoxin [Stenotrophomonas oahuensis]|uniref:Type II toxin-antitoxin system Phd/YefM family antitoxin n=1 Tax=Stenotrophomonas oahuensis TaxID=3003271 RepID=A0ABY9YSL9_9GAMM|nr:type II toxin-antitoxin system Phd/YefM family antitoxin [Stenotrophomonas sp. A5586]WNH53566.1 type II toxin-antitoxin system Phd/YefM family antitoxin [Stenotrophomonas sp. A5586]
MKTTKTRELAYTIRGKEQRAQLGGQNASSSKAARRCIAESLAMPEAADIEFEPPRISITLASVEFE